MPWALLVVGILVSACASSDEDLVVFAAASLADVAQAAADLNPELVTRISVGPTSLLSQQIQHGAPADVFLAAHPMWAERLVSSGHAQPPLIELARGRLVIVAAPGTSPARSAADAFAGAERIALADPSHVPAGQYARAALVAEGIWADVQGRLLPVADVRGALVAVQSGAADVALVYASDALAADELAVVYRFPKASTPDIRYVAVVVSDDPEAIHWVRQLETPEMQAIWQAHGFDTSGP